ncbi:TPA: hypothetical protein N0F65_001089 [Lagenidium giganteum]|uniref:Uncharacterized protein n=1 Tax=Lagenidium giganteum TaxID=4803 RepID=A0AAV2YKW0_9STRA|nr:TPA: hypothetical protein N0F65_011500 [Lagenidium giganteum]DAZ93954.1 TPA: hypothetical protein N0F65_001089 [Lagenidium giganteum]
MATGPKATAASARNAKAGSQPSTTAPPDDEDWVLKEHVELCGTVLPPAYENLRNAAHLNTFDVNERGDAVLLGENGRLFLLQLFQTTAKPAVKTDSESGKAKKDSRLLHVTLDPPLQPDEVKAIESVHVNASGTYVVLVAQQWVKVAKIPQEAGAWQRGRAGAKRTVGKSVVGSVSDQSHRFCAILDDGSMEMISLPNDQTVEDAQRQLQRQQPKMASRQVVALARDVYAATVRQVGYFSRVCHVAWHPLSDVHLVVLSDSEEISLFNMQQDVSKPEQRHLLDFKAKARSPTATSVSFCFGAAQQLWDVFTCYILRSDGSIYALCPLAPYDSRVHRSVITLLTSEVDGQLSLLKKQRSAAAAEPVKAPAHDRNWINQRPEPTRTLGEPDAAAQAAIAELKSQKYWLNEAWAPIYDDHSALASDDVNSGAEQFRCLKPHISGISPDTWPLSLQGPVDVSPKSVLEGKDNLPGGSAAASIVRVPYSLTSDPTRLGLSPLLVRAFSSGHIELVLLDAPIRPQWKSDKHFTVKKLPALLLECLNLGLDDSGGKAVLETDPADSRLVHCLHSTGSFVINVGWVSALVGGKQFTEMPKSSVRHVFGVSPGSHPSDGSCPNVVGARVVKSVLFGHLMLLRLSSGAFEIVNVSAASSELIMGIQDASGNNSKQSQKSLPDTLASISTSKANAAAQTGRAASSSATSTIKPMCEIVDEKVSALTPSGTRVTGTTHMNEVDDAVLEFVLERVKILYEDVGFADEMDQLIKDRLRLHVEMVKNQLDKAATVQQSMRATKDGLEKLKDKMERAMAVQQNLRKRAAAVLQAVKENQPQLSRAEREFQRELSEMTVEVRRMKPRVAQLTVSAQCMVRNLENASLAASTSSMAKLSSRYGVSTSILPDDKKRMCYEVLRAETQLIDDTKTLLNEMNSNLRALHQ